MVSDPEGTFDAQARLAPTSNILLIAAGSGQYWLSAARTQVSLEWVRA